MIEHPIFLIENLLKSGKGDEGRLLYLRNALKNGKTIYDSDKKYLDTMRSRYWEILSSKNASVNKSQIIAKNYSKKISHSWVTEPHKTLENKEKGLTNSFDSELESIQNSLSDLKTQESKIKDNLHLLFINREILSLPATHPSKSLESFPNLTKNSSSDLFELLKNTNTKKNSILGFKIHDAMAYVSAGLFSMWFAGYLNIVDLGLFQNLSLGLSAGAAVSAGMIYQKQKTTKE